MELDALTPAQRRAREELLDLGGERPTFPADLAVDLRDRLEDGLASHAEDLGRGEVAVNKSRLADVMACERYEVERERAGFDGWSPRVAQGTIAHKALELSVFLGGEPTPLDLVDAAIDRLVDDRDDTNGLGAWLRDAPAIELAELRAEAHERVARFVESFPPLQRSWTPRPEARVRVDLCDERVVLRGKVDLALGAPRGTTARVLIVDFKTGPAYANHVDDLRFYALLEAIRSGVPPWRVATYYLDSATFRVEDVTGDLLHQACDRVIDGVGRIIELQLQRRAPREVPNPACRWCPARDACEGAGVWAGLREDLDG
ncbi:MAG: hypothetical protein JWO37_1378 [Acidimicrobiales bacterium]|nr:hypothetical protein [Acidimicrobiales bacterium]